MDIEKDLCANALRKIALLITKAADLGMDLSGYGQAAENKYSGNVYLWLEDYAFTLYIGLGGNDRINALWSNPYDGEEETIDTHDLTLLDLETWAQELNEKAEADEKEAGQ
jgi:hypothetical protein